MSFCWLLSEPVHSKEYIGTIYLWDAPKEVNKATQKKRIFSFYVIWNMWNSLLEKMEREERSPFILDSSFSFPEQIFEYLPV